MSGSIRETVRSGLDAVRSWLSELTEPDEAHLAHTLREWAESVEGSVHIAEAPTGARVRIAGEVKAVVVRPDTPEPDLEVLLYDGTGELLVRWIGREWIRGVVPQSRLVLEGVVEEKDGAWRMVNPDFEVIAPGPD